MKTQTYIILVLKWRWVGGRVCGCVGVLYCSVQESAGTTPVQLVQCLHYKIQKVARYPDCKIGAVF
jgi:hypothetical protein